MVSTMVSAIGVVALLAASGLGLAWAAETQTQRERSENGSISVYASRDEYRWGDKVRLFIENVGEEPLTGAPRMMVLTEQGGLYQSFAVGAFVMRLDPGEMIWVDWPTTGRTPDPCMYGMADSAGAQEAGMSYPCPMPLMDVGAPTEAGSEGGVARPDIACYPCPPYQPTPQDFVVVGVFGDHADAAMITIR